jgi:hypothetical protein
MSGDGHRHAATDPTGTSDIYIGIMGIVDGIYGYSDEDNYELDDEEYADVLQGYEDFAAIMEHRAPRIINTVEDLQHD